MLGLSRNMSAELPIWPDPSLLTIPDINVICSSLWKDKLDAMKLKNLMP